MYTKSKSMKNDLAIRPLYFFLFTMLSIVSLPISSRGEENLLEHAFILNEDDSHFFSSRDSTCMTGEGLLAFVDQYANTAVTHLFLCPNAMRASFRSQTRDAIWDPVEGKSPIGRWPENARLLYERNLDLYKIWIDRCREKGISPWLSMRMNDIHDADNLSSFLHSTFWREHPEFWRVPRGTASPWQNRAMNYAYPEVREHQMAFVRELLERYDPDGLELDWMRFGWHLTPGKESEEGHYLTDFVREVRQLVQTWSEKRGHPILLGVRVPAHPDAATGLGMDGVQWGREGLVDLIVPCPFWSSSDFDIPVELWKERLGSSIESVSIAPGLEYNARPWPGGEAVANTLESAYGFAASALYRGADALYLFNWMDSETIPVSAASYRILLEKGLRAEIVNQSTRRYPVCYRDTVPNGFPDNVVLPMEGIEGGTFHIPIGSVPTSGNPYLIVGLEKRDGLTEAVFHAKVNGIDIPSSTDLTGKEGIGGKAERVLRFPCPLENLKEGYNDFHIQQNTGSPSQRMVWVEFRIEQ